MKYEKKLKVRLYTYITIIVLGLLLTILHLTNILHQGYFSSLGFAFIMVGIVRIIRHQRILSNEEAVKKQKIIETDERNLLLCTQARSYTLIISVYISLIAVIVLQILDKALISYIICYAICGVTLIYLIIYYILKRKY